MFLRWTIDEAPCSSAAVGYGDLSRAAGTRVHAKEFLESAALVRAHWRNSLGGSTACARSMKS